jgi:hypothetical protein
MAEPVFHNNQWWQQGEDGRWHSFDDASQEWKSWDGDEAPQPSSPESNLPSSSPQSWDPAAEIEEVAKNKLNSRLGVGKELRTLASYLMESERVLNMSSGLYSGANGLVVLTDRRVIFLSAGMTKNRFEDFPYEKISSVQHAGGMVFGELTIYVSGNKAQMASMIKERAKEIADYIRQRLSTSGATTQQPSYQPSPASAPSVADSDPYEQLKKLGELRDAGVLTQEEFEEKKQQILARM